MATIGEKITTIALEQLKKHPDGIRYTDLVTQVQATDASLKKNTIHATVWDLATRLPDKVYKPSRGLFRLVEFREKDTDQLKAALVPKPAKKTKEEDFYSSFADWLVNDLEDCTKAIPLGGNRFRDKWGTPDVVGKRESKKSDILQAPTEIVSAEIKTDVSQLVTAFGQACAYCLFSHKSYLVVPKESPQDEIARLDSLSQVFGIGLILFAVSSPENPQFDIRVRARKQEPDMFYANKYMRLIETEMWS
ncbi:MAG: hypothetical protein HY775_07755 [Acidobacteria bacterium]|nr:hypothetical protein [Acidobacteriota bacterium]